MRRYDNRKDDYIIDNEKADKFIADIVEVCRKHNLSLSHEDGQGGFLIDNYDKQLTRWPEDVSINDGCKTL